MNTRIKIAGLLAGILAALLVAIPLWSAAASALEVQPLKVHTASVQGGFENVSPLIIPAADFRNDGIYPLNDYYFIFSQGILWGNDTTHYGCQQAPAYLPNRANIYQFFVSVVDNDPTYDLFVRLWTAGNYNNNVADTISVVTTSGAAPGVQAPGDFVSNGMVVYPDYNYYVTVCLQGSQMGIVSARVWYDFNANVFAPLIKK